MPHATKNLMRKALPPQHVAEGQTEVLSISKPSRLKSVPNCFYNACKAGYLKRIPALFLSCLQGELWVKAIALTLVGCLLFSSVAPSYAQAVADGQRQRERILGAGSYQGVEAGVTRAFERAALQGQTQPGDWAAMMHAQMPGGGDAFVAAAMDRVTQKRQREYEAKSPVEKVVYRLEQIYKYLTSGEEGTSGQSEEEEYAEGKRYIQSVVQEAKDLLTATGSQALTAAAREELLDGVYEYMPILMAAGLLTQEQKAYFLQLFRTTVKTGKTVCSEKLSFKEKSCKRVLSAVSALAVAGGSQEDSRDISDVLSAGYHGKMGAAVIMTTVAALMALTESEGGQHNRSYLLSALKQAAQRAEKEAAGGSFDVISLEMWTLAVQSISQELSGPGKGGLWAKGYEYSFYQEEGKKGMGNIWTDLGQFLAEESLKNDVSGRTARALLDGLAQETLHMNLYRGQTRLVIAFQPFWAGAIGGGYELHNLGQAAHDEIDGNGRIVRVASTQDAWNTAQRKMQEQGSDLTGYAALVLWSNGKIDVDAYTAQTANNLLVNALNKHIRGAHVAKRAPTAAEISAAQHRADWRKGMCIADIGVAIAGLVAILVTAGESAVSSIRQFNRALRIARGVSSGSHAKRLQIARRVIRLGQLRKYGISGNALRLEGLRAGIGLPQTTVTSVARGGQAFTATRTVGAATGKAAQPAAATKAAPAAAKGTAKPAAVEVTDLGAGTARAQAVTAEGTVEFELANRTTPAPRATVASGGHAPQYSRGAVMGQMTAPVASASPSAVQVRYRPATVVNALGQQVPGWVPVQPEVGAKPSLWTIIKGNLTNSWADGWYEAKTIGHDLVASVKRNTLQVLVAAQMTLAPMLPGVAATAPEFTAGMVTTELVMKAGTSTGLMMTQTPQAFATLGSTTRVMQGAVQLAEASNLVKAATTTGRGISLAHFFLPAVATPGEIRQFGRFLDGKGVRAPQWYQDYNKVYNRYALQVRQANAQVVAGQQVPYKRQEQFVEWQNRQQQYFLNRGGVYQQQAWTLPQITRNMWDGFYLSTVAPVVLRNNVLYQNAQAQAAAHDTLAEDVWGSELFFSDDVLNKIYQDERDFFKKQNKQSVYALGVIAPGYLGIERLLRNHRGTRLAAADRRKLQQMRRRVWEAFSSSYVDKMLSGQPKESNPLLNSAATQAYYSHAVEALEHSNLSPESKKIVLNVWKTKLKSYLQTISSSAVAVDMETEGIPVYDSDGQVMTYWALDDQAKELVKSLRDNQTIYMKLPSQASLAEMWVRTEGEEPVRIRTDIEITFDNTRKQIATPTRFGWKKIVEGIILVNNRIWPLYGIYLMQGMGNVSSTISNFAQTDFTLSNTQMYLMGGISSVIMGVVSFVAGILQTKWSRNPDGTVNGTRGRNITMNIGMWAFVAAMVLPMLLGGMWGQLGTPTEWKKYLLIASFFLLGIGAAFIDVSVKNVVLAASPEGKFQPNLGYLSTFKQTVGNVGNYIIPPVVGAIVSFFGGKVDWTMFFPIYGAFGIAIALLYKFSNMHQQTLELTDKASITQAPKAKELFKLNRNWRGILFPHLWKQIGHQVKTFFHIDDLKNNKSDRKIIGHGVAATALHGMNMSILGLYVNQLFKDHVGAKFNMFDNIGADNVFQAVWTSLSQSWTGQSLLFFTVPIILGRYLGTHLMKGDIKIGSFNPRVNNGSLLIGSVVSVIAGLSAIAFGGSWPVQIVGVVLAALGLTNISPIVGGYTGNRTRHISDMVSTLLSATAILSFLGNTAFGWFKDLTATSIPWLPLLMPVAGLAYLGYFGWEIVTNAFDKEKKLILDPEHDDNAVSIMSTPIVSDDEGRLSKEIEILLENLPAEDLQKLFVGFRGLRNLSLPDIANILTKGLEANKTQYNAIHFTKDLYGGHTAEEFEKLLHQHDDTNLLMNSGAIPFVYSGATGKPVLVGLKPGVTGGIESDPRENCIIFTKDLPVEQLVIFAYLRADNKNGWYQVELNANGKLEAIPVKDYIQKQQAAAAAANAAKGSAAETQPGKISKLSKEGLLKVWGAVISGLGLGWLLGGFSGESKAVSGHTAELGSPVSVEQTIDAWKVEKEKRVQEIDRWMYQNSWYLSGAPTRRALEDARDVIEHASTREEAAASLAIFEKVQGFRLGKNEQGLLKVVFKGDAASGEISADDFYKVQEMRGGIPAKWLATKKMKKITPVFFPGGEEQISSFKFERGIDKIKIRNLLNGIRDKSGLKIRMGAHELGINAGYKHAGFKKGELHVHFETAEPDANGIYYSYRVKLEARSALKKHSFDFLRATYMDWFGHFLTDTEIPWPEEELDPVMALSKAGKFAKDNPALLLAGVGLSGLGLAALLGGGAAAAPVLLGTLPFLVRPGSIETEPGVDLSRVEKAVMRSQSHLVWKLFDEDEEVVGYAKYGSNNELERTKQFDQLMRQNKWQEQFNLLDIQYARVLAEDFDSLPYAVRQKITMSKAAAGAFGQVRSYEDRSEQPFVVSALTLQGLTLGQCTEYPELMSVILNNQALSAAEWEQVKGFFAALHKAGFQHTDLTNNLYLSRNEEGKLQLALLDFEVVRGPEDDLVLAVWQEKLEAAGLLLSETATDKETATNASEEKQKAALESLASATQYFRPRARIGIIQDEQGNPLAVWKIGSQEELDRTKKFGALVEKYKDKFPSIEVVYPYVLSEDLSALPQALRTKIEEDVKTMLRKEGRRIFILSYLGERKGALTKLLDRPGHFLFNDLKQQPVSLAEWNDIVDFWNTLNNKEHFFHTDLSGNMDLVRTAQPLGKNRLQMIIWDFENFHYHLDDSERLLLLWQELNYSNMIEQNPENPYAATAHLVIQ